MSRPLSVSSRGDGPYLQRFTVFNRTLHALVIVSFLGLVITGAPLHWPYAGWAGVLFRLLGGFQTAGVLHRVCAVITFGYFLAHLVDVTLLWLRVPDKKSIFWGPTSMVPQPKDLRDVIQMFKWFFGRGPRPRFDRYS